MKTITGISDLLDEFRRAKLMAGDHRGLKNKFELSARLGIQSLKVFFDATKRKGGKIEVYAEVTEIGNEKAVSYWYYTMKELKDEVESSHYVKEFEISFSVALWNSQGTDAERKVVISAFRYIN